MPPKKTEIINVVSIKGGVGKSVLALATAAWLARERTDIERVLYLDTDFSGTCTRYGIGKDSFLTRTNGDFLYLEELMRRIGIANLANHWQAFFERFPGIEERFQLAFSSKDHDTVREFTHFLDVERYTDLILHRLLHLIACALQDVDGNAVITLDNGPGIYGLALTLLDPDHCEKLKEFAQKRGIASLGNEISVSHLFVISPDRQDVEGLRSLLDRQIATRTDLGYPPGFNYYVVFNLFRECRGEDGVADYLATLPNALRDISAFDQRCRGLCLQPWLRLFLDPRMHGVPLWQQEEWELHKESLKHVIEPMTKMLIG